MRDAELAAAAVAALGAADVTLGEQLRGSERAVVRRAVARDVEGREQPVVLKAAGPAGTSGVREEAALAMIAAHGVPGVVPLLARSADPPLLVIADLGRGPTLADRLLGDDPVAAKTALVDWASTLGGLQAATAGLRGAFEAGLGELSPLGAPPADTSEETIKEAARTLADELPRLGVVPSGAALDELRGVAAQLDVSADGAPGGLAPGDTCPDNAVETADGTVLLDLEWAEYRHVAWEAAYLTVPFPSCWCSWRLPEEVALRALAAWRGGGRARDARDRRSRIRRGPAEGGGGLGVRLDQLVSAARARR